MEGNRPRPEQKQGLDLTPETLGELLRCGFVLEPSHPDYRYTVARLIGCPARELATRHGLSATALLELESVLGRHGLKLGARLKDWPPAHLEARK